MKMVRVTFLDSSMGGGWREDGERLRPVECHSVGWLVRRDKRHLVLAQTRNAQQVGNVLSIPRRAVTRVRVVH